MNEDSSNNSPEITGLDIKGNQQHYNEAALSNPDLLNREYKILSHFKKAIVALGKNKNKHDSIKDIINSIQDKNPGLSLKYKNQIKNSNTRRHTEKILEAIKNKDYNSIVSKNKNKEYFVIALDILTSSGLKSTPEGKIIIEEFMKKNKGYLVPEESLDVKSRMPLCDQGNIETDSESESDVEAKIPIPSGHPTGEQSQSKNPSKLILPLPYKKRKRSPYNPDNKSKISLKTGVVKKRGRQKL